MTDPIPEGAIVFESLEALSLFMNHTLETYRDDWVEPETLQDSIQQEWNW